MEPSVRPVFVFGVALVLLLPLPVGVDDVAGLVRPSQSPPSAPPLCVPASEPHVLLVYARPFDANDTFAASIPTLRRALNESNGYVQREGAAFGWKYDIRTLCDDAGLPVVREAILPTAGAADSYATIVTDLREVGLAVEPAKLLVAYEGRWLDYGGFGDVFPDDRQSPDNLNNAGGSVAVVFSTSPSLQGWVFLHELAHTLGAVQDSAPHATLAGHCNDGSDVLCKADEGANSSFESVCGTRRFDCGNDDYFSPAPAAGSYLSSHWNLAHPDNRYFSRVPAT